MTDASDHLPVADTATGALTSPASAVCADAAGDIDCADLRFRAATAIQTIAEIMPARCDFAVTDK